MGNLQNRTNNIGTIHLIAALFVMYGHQCALLAQPCPVFLGSQIQAIGVKTIFLISGYLITKSLLGIKGSRIKVAAIYILKRLSRIYPELLGCLLFSAIVIGSLFSSFAFQDYWANKNLIFVYIAKNLLMHPCYSLPGLFLGNPYPTAVNGSLWTLPVEIFLYFVILFLVICFTKEYARKILYSVVTVAFVLCSLIRFIWFPSLSFVVYGTDWIQALNVMPYFLIGGVVNFYSVNKYLNVQLGAFLVFVFAVLPFNSQFFNELSSMICLTYLICSLSFAPEQDLSIKKWIKTEYSYGIYLYGFVVQQSILHVLYSNNIYLPGVNFYFIISVIITYILAMGSYHICYKPVQKLVNKLL